MSTVKSKKLQVGTDASASNNFTIYQPSTPDGTLRIGVGNADSPTEVGRFTSSGYKPATVPMFKAYQSASAQSFANNTQTKVVFEAVAFDTTSDYDNVNYRFQPSVAGWYKFTACITFSYTSVSGQFQIWFRKNGSSDASVGNVAANNVGWWQNSRVSAMVYMNGTTDYLQCDAQQSTGASRNSSNTLANTFFEGYLVIPD